MRKLTGQKLADVYGNRYAQDLQRAAEVDTLPAIYTRYIGGGWIEISGHDLPSHKDLRTLYPNGWALHGKVRSNKAREFVRRFDAGESPIMGWEETMRYRKIRFYSKQHGETAGLVIQHDGKTFHSIEELSRLFPMHEALKMQKFQSSPVFDTWNEAFAFEFPSPTNR